MRAMKTYAQKKEHVNAPAGPFTTFSHCVYGYNIRNELISAAKLVGRDAPIAPRPLVWTTPAANYQSPTANFYTHDGNKNVSEVVTGIPWGPMVFEIDPWGSGGSRMGIKTNEKHKQP